MSFSSLPPELVHQVIESTVPHTFHSTTYPERQRTLCSLSLVSRLFRSIAQPLLFEIVKLKRLEDVRKLSGTRCLGANSRDRGAVRWLVVERVYNKPAQRTQEEEDRFPESLHLFATVTKLTTVAILHGGFTDLLSTTSHNLASLQLSSPHFQGPGTVPLPNLHDLALFNVSHDLFVALTTPTNVPNLRNFAFVDSHPSYAEYFTQSKFSQLLPHLETLSVSDEIWSDPQAAFLHSAASRTLVDFDSEEWEELGSSTTTHRHIRISYYISYSTRQSSASAHKNLQAHLNRWSSLIEDTPSLPLKSIYLDSSLRPFDVLPLSTRLSLETLVRLCLERKIDLVFEHLPIDCSLDPYISQEFVRRQAEQRRKEAESSGVIKHSAG